MTRARARRALFLSRDPGSVEAMLPVACALSRRAGWRAEVVALAGQEDAVAAALGHGPARVLRADRDGLPSALGALLDDRVPDVVVSGSSPARGVAPQTPEQHLVGRARERGIPSVGILDFWGFYRERFVGPSGLVEDRLVPDRLCVLDRACRDDLAVLGVPAERMAITHNPGLDALVAEIAAVPPSPRDYAGDGLHLVFASQPLAENARARGWPMTQHALFEAVLSALPRDVPVRLSVWMHPLEDPRLWEDRFGTYERGRVVVAPGIDRGAAALLHADALLTSHSSVAYRAGLCATPVISFRPFPWTREAPVIDRVGLAHVAQSREELAAVLQRFDPARARSDSAARLRALAADRLFVSDGCATGRVVAVVEDAAGSGGRP